LPLVFQLERQSRFDLLIRKLCLSRMALKDVAVCKQVKRSNKMPHTEDYQAKLEIISAISEQDLKSPAMPVDVYLQEAENLFHWASDDKEALMGVGLDWEWVADLKGRTDALRQLESI
jgi:uncharacterized protein (DUF111 family)